MFHAARPDSNLRFLITTRPLPEINSFDPGFFAHYILRPFERKQVEAFAQNWFTQRNRTDADASERFLRQVEDSRIFDIAQIPLLLTMAAVVYELDTNKI